MKGRTHAEDEWPWETYENGYKVEGKGQKLFYATVEAELFVFTLGASSEASLAWRGASLLEKGRTSYIVLEGIDRVEGFTMDENGNTIGENTLGNYYQGYKVVTGLAGLRQGVLKSSEALVDGKGSQWLLNFSDASLNLHQVVNSGNTLQK